MDRPAPIFERAACKVELGECLRTGGFPINNRQLLYFVKVLESGSLTAASEQLNVAQPALGLQIRNLEEELGVPLMVRHSRGVQATPAGELLSKRAEHILRSFEELAGEIRSFAGRTRDTIRFGITPSAMALLGPDLLLEANETMPDVFFSLIEELSYVLIDALESGDLDIALTYHGGARSSLARRPVMEEELLLISSPEHDSSTEPVSFLDLSKRDLVLAGPRDIIRCLIDDTAMRLSLPLNVVYEAQSVSATKNLLEKGLASGVMPYGSVAKELKASRLVARRIVQPAIFRTLYIVRRQRASASAYDAPLDAFLEGAITVLQDKLGDLCRPINVGNRNDALSWKGKSRSV